MDIQATSRAIKDVACDALVVSVVRARGSQGNTSITLSGAARAVDSVLDGLISQLGSDGEFKGNLGEMTTSHTMGKLAAKRVVIVGLGSQETVNTQSIRRASAIPPATYNIPAHTR